MTASAFAPPIFWPRSLEGVVALRFLPKHPSSTEDCVSAGKWTSLRPCRSKVEFLSDREMIQRLVFFFSPRLLSLHVCGAVHPPFQTPSDLIIL